MDKEYINRETVKRELLSWAVSLNHPEYLIKDDALHIIDSMSAADVVEQEQESKPLKGWISVQDRLPEESGYYLVFTDIGRIALLSYSKKYQAFNAHDDSYSEEYVITVTHWMPLPNPPKGE